jgi:hypothetical protein
MGKAPVASLFQKSLNSVQHQVFLRVSVPDRGMWYISRLGRFTPGGEDADMHWMSGWEGHITGLDTTASRMIS